MFRIRDVLIRIRSGGFVPLDYGSGSGSCSCQHKALFSQVFCFLLTEGTLKINKLLQSHKTVEIKAPHSFLLLYRGIRTRKKITGPNLVHSLRQSSEFLIFLNCTVPYLFLNSGDQNPQTLVLIRVQ
jgi:hypothetical protein